MRLKKSSTSTQANEPSSITNLIGFWLTVIFTVAAIVLFVAGWQQGYFKNEQKMANLIGQFGIWGTIGFGFFQAFQVIVPLIPGGVTVPAGVLIFGLYKGTIISTVSIVLASWLAFYLARHYGWKLISHVTTKDQYNSAQDWLKNIKKDQPINPNQSPTTNRFKRLIQRLNNSPTGINILIIITMLVPGFPADLLSYIYGLTNVKTSHFMLIILITKPINTFLYGVLLASPVKMLQ